MLDKFKCAEVSREHTFKSDLSGSLRSILSKDTWLLCVNIEKCNFSSGLFCSPSTLSEILHLFEINAYVFACG